MNSPEESAAWFVAHTRRRGGVCRSVLIRDLGTGSESPSLLARNPGLVVHKAARNDWIPAFAGMTGSGRAHDTMRGRGKDGLRFMLKSLLSRVGVCLIAVVLAAGCATTSNGASDKAQISELLAKWKQALLSNNLDQIMSLYSEDFLSSGRDKAAAAPYLKEAMEEGAAKDVRINVEDATIMIKGDKASVLPIALSRRDGANSMRLDLAKENGRWMIVGMEGKRW